MPLYEYQCKKCKHRFEKIHQSYSEPRVKKCPKCGGPVEELLSAPAAHFKGSGWYATDYARKSEGGKSGAEGASKESGSAESVPDDSSASKAKEKTETKSAEKESSKEAKPKTESKKRK